ncbi:class I SAM-dependent methyltransferase [Longimicrobium sp.]|uniref:class I SAM-dependent methyltransferase n=1 Tax=Longimicrobium sp. TaxID=2029185 RepID=UPI003B3B4AA8
MTDQDREAALIWSWMANADAWTRAVREGRIASRRLATDAAIVQAVAELQPGRVLDLGCGEGWLMRALAERGIEAIGLDVSLELVMAAEETGGGRYRCCSYDELVDDPTRAGGPYDAIACNFSLLSANLVPLLTALRANLAPGGALVIQTVHPWTAAGDEGYADGWRTETFDAFGGEFAEPMPWYFRTLGSWTDALRGAGFRLATLREPIHPETGQPASLLMVAEIAAG